jgi:glycosyltransferase involved in cell wall biosynthesis
MNIPFFTIVTATYKDAWNLSKTIQSVMSQNHKLFEYIVIDNNSNDETDSLINFWNQNQKQIKYIKEKDDGVYNAMNKGIHYANGQFICFMNAGDKFKSPKILDIVYEYINRESSCQALLGWGELGDDIYAPWICNVDAFAMSTLGFCHQSLYVKKEIIEEIRFDDRYGKTDSDILQLARIVSNIGQCHILNEVLAIRSDDPGISSNLETTKKSNIWTIVEYYEDINESEATCIVEFKRDLKNFSLIKEMIQKKSQKTALAIALTIIDVLIVKPKKILVESSLIADMLEKALQVIKKDAKGIDILKNLDIACAKIKFYLENMNSKKAITNFKTKILEDKESIRISKINIKKETNIVVSLTSFPKRFGSLHLVLQSIFNQTVKPKKILLHLALSEVKNPKWIPSKIQQFIKDGLEIVFLDKNYFQYNKFLFMKTINLKNPFITIDDDILYPPTTIENLIAFHKKYPNCVVANRIHKIMYDAMNNVIPYSNWKKEIVYCTPDHNNFATGVGGVLYPKGFIDDYCTNTNFIMSSAPYADDVWLKIVALKKNIKVISTDLEKHTRWYCGYTPETFEDALQNINVATGLNDYQFTVGLNLIGANGKNLNNIKGIT